MYAGGGAAALKRNEAAHGRLDIELRREELAALVEATRIMLDLPGASTPEPRAA